jgi:hypothetical protein
LCFSYIYKKNTFIKPPFNSTTMPNDAKQRRDASSKSVPCSTYDENNRFFTLVTRKECTINEFLFLKIVIHFLVIIFLLKDKDVNKISVVVVVVQVK